MERPGTNLVPGRSFFMELSALTDAILTTRMGTTREPAPHKTAHTVFRVSAGSHRRMAGGGRSLGRVDRGYVRERKARCFVHAR